MKNTAWAALIKTLPPRLSIKAAAAQLGVPYSVLRLKLRRFGYRWKDGRHESQNHRRRFDPDGADWGKSNIVLARQFGVSRERVRAVRRRLGRQFVESRGRKALEK